MTSTNSMHYDDSKHSMYSNPGLQSVTSSRATHEQPYSGQHQRSNSSNGGVYPHHASSALGNSNSRSLNGAREFTSTPVADAYLQTFPAADSTQSHARATLQHQQSHDSDKSNTGDKHHTRANSMPRNEAYPQYKHQQYTLPRRGAAAEQLSDASSSSGYSSSYSHHSQQSAAPNPNTNSPSVSSMPNQMSNMHITTTSATDISAAVAPVSARSDSRDRSQHTSQSSYAEDASYRQQQTRQYSTQAAEAKSMNALNRAPFVRTQPLNFDIGEKLRENAARQRTAGGASGGVSPTLNTVRLRPIRQITRNAVVNILALFMCAL